MGKKKETLRNSFKESIDPRFSGIFTSAKNNISNESNSNVSQPVGNIATGRNFPTVNENTGFQTFISSKLAMFLDSHIKEVDRPVSEQDFFANKSETIQLFSDSDAITEEQVVESVQRKMKKKKKKDRDDKELLKEAAVSFDWLQQQAQILNS